MASFTHIKLKLRLGMMRFRINHPALNLGIKIILLVALVAISFFVYGLWKKSTQPTTDNNQPVVQIKTHSINAEILSTSTSGIVVKADIPQVQDGVTTFTAQERSILLTPTTEIVKITIKNKEVVTIPATAADLKIKKTIAIYSNSDPVLDQPITANKIEIIE